ncbi:MAG: pectate lyase family protein [Flavisolibacter sp.]
MKNVCALFLLLSSFGLLSCSSSRTVVVPPPENSEPIAFPGAEGFGRFATGGRGGEVMIVTNLEDSGPGSFRAAVESKKPGIVVFAVDGTIHLQSPLGIKSNKTIAGQTAPGDGICIADQPVKLEGNNIIVRYLRFRMGDKYQNTGKVDRAGSDDAFGGVGKSNIIIDHCSMSWSTDEALSVYGGDSLTLQWNIISEPLNYSYHFEDGDKDFEQHGYGGIWGGKNMSAHHNLFAHCNSRTPRFNGIRHYPKEFVDFRNNVIYNWGHNNAYAGEGGFYNMVNNYYKFGPSTKANVRYRIFNPWKNDKIPFGEYYVNGNYVDGASDVTNDNLKGVTFSPEATEMEKNKALLSAPIPSPAVSTQNAEMAYQLVLMKAGASYRRDTLDMRIARDVEKRTGRIIDVQGGYPHGTPYDQTVNAWPALKKGVAKTDSDADGMPDEWERTHGLDANDASDAMKNTLQTHYSNIEVYINSLL